MRRFLYGKRWASLALGAVLLLGNAALADGPALESERYNQEYFSLMQVSRDRPKEFYEAYFNGYDAQHSRTIRIVSKNASIWAEPKTNSAKLGTAKNGENLTARVDSNGAVIMSGEFYAVTYDGKDGWVNSAYAVRAPLEIVLMESNVPAYCAPDSASKKVGSLAKLTRYTVLGFYGDYYVISLREAAAFVPMSVRHYDTSFESLYLSQLISNGSGKTIRSTTLRTGPGMEYAAVEDVGAGYTFECLDEINGWYALTYASKSTDGTVIVYVPAEDAEANWG